MKEEKTPCKDWEFVRNFECNRCHGLFREVYAMKFDRLETLRKPIRRINR